MAFLEELYESFGGIFKKGSTEDVSVYKKNEQLTDREEDDGSSIQISPSGFFGTFIDLDNKVKSEDEYITLVRGLAQEPEFDYAISEIINELIVIDEDEEPVKIDLEHTELSESVKKKITDEFDNILRLLNFTSRGYDVLRQWYIDGKLYYHVIVDDKNPRHGIKELRNIDPRKIKKIKEIEKANKETGAETIIREKDYFMFNAKATSSTGTAGTTGIKIHPDRVVFVHSGLKNPRTNSIISHLHKSIKRYNQLRLLEESVIIYRFSRAPERRVFYVNTGGMPPKKGEKYLHDIMMRFRNKIVYDANTGQISDQKKYMSLLEDYFLPRNGQQDGTEIKTLSGTQLSNGMEDVNEFRKQFYLSLNVPISRLEPETGFSLGRASEISREEVKFARFCTRLRVRFSDLFDEILQKQLLLKNVVNKEDWDLIKQKVKYKYNIDTHFKELLDQEVLQSRLRVLQDIQEFTPRAFHDASFPLFSVEWVKKHVLLQTEAEIGELRMQSDREMQEIEMLQAFKEQENGLATQQQEVQQPEQQQVQQPEQQQVQQQ